MAYNVAQTRPGSISNVIGPNTTAVFDPVTGLVISGLAANTTVYWNTTNTVDVSKNLSASANSVTIPVTEPGTYYLMYAYAPSYYPYETLELVVTEVADGGSGSSSTPVYNVTCTSISPMAEGVTGSWAQNTLTLTMPLNIYNDSYPFARTNESFSSSTNYLSYLGLNTDGLPQWRDLNVAGAGTYYYVSYGPLGSVWRITVAVTEGTSDSGESESGSTASSGSTGAGGSGTLTATITPAADNPISFTGSSLDLSVEIERGNIIIHGPKAMSDGRLHYKYILGGSLPVIGTPYSGTTDISYQLNVENTWNDLKIPNASPGTYYLIYHRINVDTGMEDIQDISDVMAYWKIAVTGNQSTSSEPASSSEAASSSGSGSESLTPVVTIIYDNQSTGQAALCFLGNLSVSKNATAGVDFTGFTAQTGTCQLFRQSTNSSHPDAVADENIGYGGYISDYENAADLNIPATSAGVLTDSEVVEGTDYVYYYGNSELTVYAKFTLTWQSAGSSEPASSEDPVSSSEPASSSELASSSEQVSSEESSSSSEPASSSEPVSSEGSSSSSEPASSSELVSSEDSVSSSEPASSSEPVSSEESSSSSEPASSSEPVSSEESASSSEPASSSESVSSEDSASSSEPASSSGSGSGSGDPLVLPSNLEFFANAVSSEEIGLYLRGENLAGWQITWDWSVVDPAESGSGVDPWIAIAERQVATGTFCMATFAPALANTRYWFRARVGDPELASDPDVAWLTRPVQAKAILPEAVVSRSNPLLLARIMAGDEALSPEDISSITWSLTRKGYSLWQDTSVSVEGYTSVSVPVFPWFLEAPVVDYGWTKDEVGYNLLVALPPAAVSVEGRYRAVVTVVTTDYGTVSLPFEIE